MQNNPRISICIPTFNRAQQVKKLVVDMLEIGPEVEVCVHVDGSPDTTLDDLLALGSKHENLKVTNSNNQGRAHALIRAIESASAPFIMLYDDDDDILPARVQSVLPLLDELDPDICGIICHLKDDDGNKLGTEFPNKRSNFLKLRFDEKVEGDKKEIVRSDLLRRAVYRVDSDVRRAPTSLLWNRMALTHDVICMDVILGTKRYLPEGYTRRVRHQRP